MLLILVPDRKNLCSKPKNAVKFRYVRDKVDALQSRLKNGGMNEPFLVIC